MSRHRRLVSAPQRGNPMFSLLFCLVVPSPSAWLVASCFSIRTQFRGLVTDTTRLTPSSERENYHTPGTVKLCESPGKAGGLP